MKRTLACVLALGLFGALAGAGCSDDPDPSTTGGNNGGTVSLDAFASEVAKLYCNRIYNCCTTAEQAEVFDNLSPTPKNEQECATQMTQLYVFFLGPQKDSVEAGRESYDGTKAANCIAKTKNTCEGFLDNEQFEDDDECNTIFTGKVADGGACKIDEDCSAAGSKCLADVCAPLGAEGQACDFSSDCQEGLVCGLSSMCAKPKADGQMCDGGFDCASEYCDLDTGTCAPKLADGKPCFISSDCQSGNCAMDVCAPKLADGAMCMSDSECQSDTCDFSSSTCSAGGPACDGM